MRSVSERWFANGCRNHPQKKQGGSSEAPLQEPKQRAAPNQPQDPLVTEGQAKIIALLSTRAMFSSSRKRTCGQNCWSLSGGSPSVICRHICLGHINGDDPFRRPVGLALLRGRPHPLPQLAAQTPPTCQPLHLSNPPPLQRFPPFGGP